MNDDELIRLYVELTGASEEQARREVQPKQTTHNES
jgi:hypothetical protein